MSTSFFPGPQTHTFIAYVEDQPGVLNRVTSLFRRRGYNIVSLNVGRTNQEGVSRMTMVVEADDDKARRIEANLYKMVNVLSVEDITHKSNVSRDLVLLPYQAGRARRALPDAVHLTLPKCGHVPMIDDVDLVVDVLLEGSNHPRLGQPRYDVA